MMFYRQAAAFITLMMGLSLVLISCTSANTIPTNPTQAVATTFKVAMLLSGPIDDKAWNSSGYEGLRLIKEKLNAEVAYQANIPEANFEKVFRQYAGENFDFVIGHGGQFVKAAEVVAQEFPRTKFAVMTSYEGNNKNLGALSFREDEMGYLAGVIAAMKTKTNKVAYLGGQPLPHLKIRGASFEKGAKSIKPDLEAKMAWVDSWNNPDKASQVTQTLLDAGTDVIALNLNADTATALKMIEEQGIFAIGWTTDQYDMAPKTIVTSVVQQVPMLILEGAALVQKGRWEGKLYKFGLQEGVQELAPFRGSLTPEQEAKVKAAEDDIKAGKINSSTQ